MMKEYLSYAKRRIVRKIRGEAITKKKIRDFLEQEGFSYITVIGVNEVPNGIYESYLLWVEVRKMFVEIEVIGSPRWRRCVQIFDKDWNNFEREFRVKKRELEALISLENI